MVHTTISLHFRSFLLNSVFCHPALCIWLFQPKSIILTLSKLIFFFRPFFLFVENILNSDSALLIYILQMIRILLCPPLTINEPIKRLAPEQTVKESLRCCLLWQLPLRYTTHPAWHLNDLKDLSFTCHRHANQDRGPLELLLWPLFHRKKLTWFDVVCLLFVFKISHFSYRCFQIVLETCLESFKLM